MRPAMSVVFLTTLSGAAQGLLTALVAVEVASDAGLSTPPPAGFYVGGSMVAVVLGALGLLASFFHLGHPERAWRAVAMWRTSWLSRECLALPVFLALACVYGAAHFFCWAYTPVIGVLGVFAAATLFVCTSKIYSCLRFLQEWASPFTLVNFTLLGCASGFTLATLCAAFFAPPWAMVLAPCACLLTLAGFVSRLASLARNARLRPKSTVQSATGIHAQKLVQKSRGFTAGAPNMKEFFHGKSQRTLDNVKLGFLLGAFILPFFLVALSTRFAMPIAVLMVAFAIQYAGLVAERWFFFAEARHPQNIYYQQAS
jgi:DMSO reductase anchor subunit